ncbi:MAG: DUF1730 domain-containing protein [Proteobacteria bacterium]|nr:DUF1730 domain-containing protein [Pseudomonadota bacterium]
MDYLKKLCQTKGVICLGILAGGKPDPEYGYFQNWLTEGKHAQMHYLSRYGHFRKHPWQIEKDMPHLIVCAATYPAHPRNPTHPRNKEPQIAAYARLKDYHKVLKKVAKEIIEELARHLNVTDHQHRCVVDTAPILEKSLATQTQAGFRGKNSLFILPGYGSYLFLFEIYTDLPLKPTTTPPKEKPLQRHNTAQKTQTKDKDKQWGCGTCRRCQVHCPTAALSVDYVLDARRCLAYYTIEHRGLIPVTFWDHLAKYYFGCDICQRVCPHNRYAQQVSIIQYKIPTLPPLPKVAMMDENTYIQLFAATPMTRPKRTGLRRNALIALYITKYPDFSKLAESIRNEGEPLLVETLKQRNDYLAYKNSQTHPQKHKQTHIP